MRFIITGGGSGGHIYPALAVADEIKDLRPESEIILVGSKRGLEKKIFGGTSYKSYYLPVGQLHSSVGRVKQFVSILKLPLCIVISFYILLKYRPKAVLGVGGYASGPLGIAATILGIKTYIWEGNAAPGITNKILGKFNTIPFLVFESAAKYFTKNKPILTGVPVRKQFEKNLEFLDTKQKGSQFRVLFVGGSQGARVFNNFVPEMVNKHSKKLLGIEIIHQTGIRNFEEVQKKYIKKFDNVEVLPYLDPILHYYQSADLIFSRSGAGAVNELSFLGKPVVLVPFPKASDDHQKQNALDLVGKSAALLLEEKDVTAESILNNILSLKENPDKLKELSKLYKGALPRGARELIAKTLITSN